VAVAGSDLSATLLGRNSESTNTLCSNGNIPMFCKPAKILDVVIEGQCWHFRILQIDRGTPGCWFSQEQMDAS
jgi:hypothetical protein